MAYEELYTTDGLYLVNRELVKRIIRDAAYARSKNVNAHLVVEKQGWGLPELRHYEIDYARAREDARSAIEFDNFFTNWMRKTRNRHARSSQMPTGKQVEDRKEWLFSIEKDGRLAQEDLKRKQKELSKKVMNDINRYTDNWGVAVEVAKFTRDASAEIVLVGGTILTGGTAGLAVHASGSLLKGAAKYQDTGNLGAGVMQASVSFVTVVIPGPKAGMDKAMARTLLFTKAKTEFVGGVAVGTIEGKSLGEASLSSAIDVGLGGLVGKIDAKLLPEEDLKALLKVGAEKLSVPVGLGIMNVSKSGVQQKLGDVVTRQLMAMAKGKKNLPSTKSLKPVRLASPVLVDLAIIGPDRSVPPRTW